MSPPGALGGDIKLMSALSPLASLVCRRVGRGLQLPRGFEPSAGSGAFRPAALDTTALRSPAGKRSKTILFPVVIACKAPQLITSKSVLYIAERSDCTSKNDTGVFYEWMRFFKSLGWVGDRWCCWLVKANGT